MNMTTICSISVLIVCALCFFIGLMLFAKSWKDVDASLHRISIVIMIIASGILFAYVFLTGTPRYI